MRLKSVVLTLLVFASTAHAKELKAYQDAKLLQMDSVACGSDTNGAGKGKTHELLCQEYSLQTEQAVYRIRSKSAKHAVLLPVGENAQFRLEKLKMLLRVESLDGKEREFVVVSVKPRGEIAADASPARVNHLQ